MISHIRGGFAAQTDRTVQQEVNKMSKPVYDLFDSSLDEPASAVQTTGSGYGSVFSEYTSEVLSRMMNSEWALKPAKSSEQFGNFDQSLFSHVLHGAYGLYQVAKTVEIDLERFRNALGMWSVHEIHKLDPELKEEFKIESTTVSQIVSRFNVDEFSPELELKDFHSVAVGHHRFDDSALSSDLTETFLQNQGLIRTADAIASESTPEYGSEDLFSESVASISNWDFTTTSHQISRVDGVFAAILNRAVASYLSENGASPVDMMESGCVYLHPSEKSVDELLPHKNPEEQILEKFISVLKETLPEYSSRISLPDAADESEYRRVPCVTGLEIACLTTEEIVSAIVRASLQNIDMLNSVTEVDRKNVRETNSRLEEMADVEAPEIECSARLSAVYTLVSAIDENLAKELVVDTDSQDSDCPPSQSSRLGILLSAFGLSSEQYRILQPILHRQFGSEKRVRRQHIKYIISQLIIEQYFKGDSHSSVAETLSNDIVSRLSAQNPNWGDFGEEITQTVKVELRRAIARLVTIDGERIHTHSQLSPIHGFSNFTYKSDCAICGRQTMMEPGRHNQPKLISATQDGAESKLDTKSVVGTESEPVDLDSFLLSSSRTCCTVCQIDMRVQIGDGWKQNNSGMFCTHFGNSYSPIADSIHSQFDELTNTNIIEKTSAMSPVTVMSELPIKVGWNQDESLDDESAFGVHTSGATATNACVRDMTDGQFDTLLMAYHAVLSAVFTGKHVNIRRYPVFGQDLTETAKSDSVVTVSDTCDKVIDCIGKKISIDNIKKPLIWLRVWGRISEISPNFDSATKLYDEYSEFAFPASMAVQSVIENKIHLTRDEQREVARTALSADSVGVTDPILSDVWGRILTAVKDITDSLSTSLGTEALSIPQGAREVENFFSSRFGVDISQQLPIDTGSCSPVVSDEELSSTERKLEEVSNGVIKNSTLSSHEISAVVAVGLYLYI